MSFAAASLRLLGPAVVLAAIGGASVHCRSRVSHDRPTHGRLGNDRVVLHGESRGYVLVEPARSPAATATRSLFARVTFDERHLAAIGAPVSGRVASVEVVTGDKVRAGAVLLTIHSADVAAAQAALSEARQGRLLAEQTAARAARMVEQGAGSVMEREQAVTALAQARAEEDRAARALTALGVQGNQTDYVLKSPIAGTVVERNVAVGNTVSGGTPDPLVTVADLASVWVVADVYEPDLPYVHAGDRTTVTISAIPGRSFEGEVDYVAQVVEQATRAARARIVLPNSDGALRPGMFAQVHVQSVERATAEVPKSAVLARRDEYYVFVEAQNGTFVRRTVRLGTERGDDVAVVDGLQSGEPVVTRGAILLDAESNAL